MRHLASWRILLCGFVPASSGCCWRSSARHERLWHSTAVAESEEIHAGIAAGLENGTLRPIVGKELPLKDAPVAHKEILAPGAYGKMVLVP